MSDAAKATIARRLRTQAGACQELGSPLYARLLDRAAADVEAGGVAWRLLEGHEGDPGPSALALRLLGAVHRLALTGAAPELARHYPSAGGTDRSDPWPAFASTLETHLDLLRREVDRGVQTNEVGRAAALVGGFLTVARETGLPLRVLEVGTSASLLLRWDHFAYRQGERTWGPPASPVQLGDRYEAASAPLPFDVDATVVERRGCDPHPIDPTTDEGRLTLMSFAWPDMTERYELLEGAIDIARRVPAVVDRAEAAPWVAAQLAEPTPGIATVVYHSVVMQYLTEAGRAAFRDALDEAGTRATADAPLAWLRFEPERGLLGFVVRLVTWPGGEERHLADSGAHGRPVRYVPL